jgi:hypothetical protein
MADFWPSDVVAAKPDFPSTMIRRSVRNGRPALSHRTGTPHDLPAAVAPPLVQGDKFAAGLDDSHPRTLSRASSARRPETRGLSVGIDCCSSAPSIACETHALKQNHSPRGAARAPPLSHGERRPLGTEGSLTRRRPWVSAGSQSTCSPQSSLGIFPTPRAVGAAQPGNNMPPCPLVEIPSKANDRRHS